MRSRALGPLRIHRIVEIERMAVQADRFLLGMSEEANALAKQWLDERFIEPRTNELFISFHSFVLEAGGRRILVDACHGNDKRRTGNIAYADSMRTDYLTNLANAGFAPEDIDIVLCTHLHYDHVGWNTRLENGRWVPTFPNARYLMTKIDFDHFSRLPANTPESHHAAAFEDSVLPVVRAAQADLLAAADVPSFDLSRGVRLELAPGHTPGSIVVHLQNDFGRAILSGDVIHHPLQIFQPALHVEGEHDSAQATRTREMLIEQCAETGALLLPAHFPAPTAGKIVRRDGGFRFDCGAE
ncbi:MAG TPA: MBL fold metallo-hydrolase [Alphaproteobacteria bacterium]|nr:MBL fold metallo-hydrolase [Alphaproteobacteria bacterium]